MNRSKSKSLIIFLVLAILLSSCQETTKLSETTSSVEETEAKEIIPVDEAELKTYLYSIVNGPYREFLDLANFANVKEVPEAVWAGSSFLEQALLASGQSSIARKNYEQYLQVYVNAEIVLPQNGDYPLNYNADDDEFYLQELPGRNFRPETYFEHVQISQEEELVYFDAYEINLCYVNPASGQTERDNPLARLVVDGISVGFATPIVKRELYLIDYQPLGKTRYTFEQSTEGLRLLSKTSLEPSDPAYKASAQDLFSGLEATRRQAQPNGRVAVYNWAADNAELLGTLDPNTIIWVVDVFADSEYLLGAPAAQSGVFDYNLAFGFMSRNNLSLN